MPLDLVRKLSIIQINDNLYCCSAENNVHTYYIIIILQCHGL